MELVLLEAQEVQVEQEALVEQVMLEELLGTLQTEE